MIPKDTDKMRFLFIPTASRTEEEKFYVRKSFDQLIGLGVRNDNIFWFDPEDFSTHRIKQKLTAFMCAAEIPFSSSRS
jgi:peptidase E